MNDGNISTEPFFLHILDGRMSGCLLILRATFDQSWRTKRWEFHGSRSSRGNEARKL